MKHLLPLFLFCLITSSNYYPWDYLSKTDTSKNDTSRSSSSIGQSTLPRIPEDHFPQWAEGIVWYQIFPERFANGDTLNDPKANQVFVSRPAPKGWEKTRWTSNWFAQSEWEKRINAPLRNKITMRRYGGDIQGVIDHLDYIKDLGAGAIYFNPVFESLSMHKYDASTYHHIDANYGPDPDGDRKIMNSETPDDPLTWKWTEADKLFLKLIKEVHKRNMRIIIDGVFNHTGTEFWAFKDIVKNGRQSKFFDWYQITSLDDPATLDKNELDYKGWWGYKGMPEFNRTKDDLMAGPKNYIFNITRRWMSPDGNTEDGVDGWRLDVAREVPLGFWRSWNKLVKSINPQAYIVGEFWELSKDFVGTGDAFDALMNYNFAYAVNDFFIAHNDKLKVSKFTDELKVIDKTYPENTLLILQNLVDSHDTDRLSSMIMNPDRKFDKDNNEDNPEYNPAKPQEKQYRMQKLIAAFQMTYRGAPMIYYGDEVGMWGADDPHDRKPMIWENLSYDDEVIDQSSGFKKGYGRYKVEQNLDLLAFYRKVISIHNGSSALRQGGLEFIYSNDSLNTFAFKRYSSAKGDSDICIAAFNLGRESDTFNINGIESAEDLLNSTSVQPGDGTLKITLPPGSVVIYRIKNK